MAEYSPSSVKEAWDNHFAAFGGQDLEKILLDYDENSIARVHNDVTGATSEFKGLSGIRTMFTGLFADLSDLSTLAAPVVQVEEDAKQVFLVWKCPGCGYDNATDTFIFTNDKKFKIARQNIVVTKREATDNNGYAPKSVQQAWDNHFAAFGARDVDKIMLDYDDNSVARVHNNVTLETMTFKGAAKIREMFVGLFADLKDLSSLSAPVVEVEEAAKQVFLIWKCPGCGYDNATDTFIFGDDYKIKRQNIVVSNPTKVLGSGPYKARFQQTMLRIKDPKVSVPWYIENFGMTLIHWIDFPQWKFTVYFLEILPEGMTPPECTLEKATKASENYWANMSGHAIELTHNHGSESDPDFKVWNGNTGKDGEGANFAEAPAHRGFGHMAFNCDDVQAACDKLEAKGVKFQKKPDEGRMKGLAFALDPDGYWLEIVKRNPMGWSSYFNLSQCMLRVKDGPATVEFYTKHLGFTLIRQMDFPDNKFSLFFLANVTQEELDAALKLDTEGGGVLDPMKPNGLSKILWNCCLELTWNHGTENDEEFQIHDGNAQPQGFGHIGFLMDDLEDACEKMEAAGVKMKKKPKDGNMRNLAFCYDPNGYWVEMIDRKASFAGVCANY